MAGVLSFDEFTGEWYPGYRPEFFDFPYVVDGASPFRPGDEKAFWFLDFHWSRGLTPLAATLWSADGYCAGRLEVHHITKVEADSDLAFDLDNLVTLCQRHHKAMEPRGKQ